MADTEPIDRFTAGRTKMRAGVKERSRRRKGLHHYGSPPGPTKTPRSTRYDPERKCRIGANGVDFPICGAKTTGKHGLCTNLAGHGTNHYGYGPCQYHLGNSPNIEHRYALIMAEEEMLAREALLGAPIEVAPAEALLWCVHITAGHVAWLHSEIGNTPRDQLESTQTRALIALYNGERDRLARFSKMAIDGGANEKMVEWTTAQAIAVIEVTNQALDAVGNLTEAQKNDFVEAMGRGLREIEGSSPDRIIEIFERRKLPDVVVNSDSEKSMRARKGGRGTHGAKDRRVAKRLEAADS
jgi:hypothetical protein